MLKPFLSFMFLVTLSSACGEEVTEKGTEEQALTGGKSDSFFKPTHHGDLTFGVPSQAQISKDARFHAWTFTLSDDAKVTLKTDVSTNLDTVMYLYRRDNPSDSWGRYIKKNDDHKGNIWSQITLKGKAAEYRVIVKPFKKALKGSFKLDAQCDGAGCVSTNPGPTCASKVFNAAGGMGFTDICSTKIMNIAMSPQVSSSSTSVAFEKHCELGGVEQLAVEHYADYIESFAGNIEDIFDFGGPIEFEIDHIILEGGHEIFVNAGSDEDGASLFYDTDLNLIALYQHNQSPSIEYYCGEANDTTAHLEPFAECAGAVLFDTPAKNEDPLEIRDGEMVLDDLAGEDFIGINDIIFDFTEANKADLSDTTPISFSYHFYGQRDNNTVAELRLWLEAKTPITYTTYKDFNGVMFVSTTNGKSHFKCEK